MWQFRLQLLVLHSFSCGCPPQLYLVTAGDLLSIGSPRGREACRATEVAYTPSDFIGRSQWRIDISLIGHRGGRRQGQNLTQLAGRWALVAAFPNGGKLCTVSVCCGQDPLLGPSWSNGLLASPGDGEAMCRSGGQPEANSQNGEDKSLDDYWRRWPTTPHITHTRTDTNFYVVSLTRGSWTLSPPPPHGRDLTGRQPSGNLLPWRWRVDICKVGGFR
jgi:hypothetical protein